MASVRDFFRRKAKTGDSDPVTTKKDATALAADKSEVEHRETMSVDEEKRLGRLLLQARAKEQSGDLQGAYELYKKYKEDFLAIRKRQKSGEVPEFVISSCAAIKDRLAERAAELGVSLPDLKEPVLPDIVSAEHIETLTELFGTDNLEPVVSPAPEMLTEDYFTMMYPEIQRREDQDKEPPLISHRPSWWGQAADTSIVGPATETWGQAFTRSLKSEAEHFGGKVIFTESIQKPQYIDGSQQYGSKEGADASRDPLLPVIQEVFGDEANRFNLSWDQITRELLPKIKEKITNTYRSRGLEVPAFAVEITPALVNNLQTTLLHPENSGTDTFEWCASTLLKQDGTDSGLRLVVGVSGYGGAGYVNCDHRGYGWDYGGFRLSVVFSE